MDKQRILVIGGNGSGKTTFSIELAQKFNLPLVHLDVLGWRGNWEPVPREEFDAALFAELEKPQWIIDGNYQRTLPERLKYCDTVFYFDFPTIKCLWGVTSRVLKNWGKSRNDMGGYCPERFDWSFYKNVLNFNKANREKTYRMLSEAKDVDVVIFKNRKQVKEYLRRNTF